MTVWSYSAHLRRFAEVLDFCSVYFTTLLGRCAVCSLPILGAALLLRNTVWRERPFEKGAVWAAVLPAMFLGKLRMYYTHRAFLPLVYWQSWCSGFWWVRYGYLAGIAASLIPLFRRCAGLRRILRNLSAETIDGQRVFLCDMPVSPFAAGLLSPKIVLPKTAWERLEREDLRTILLHERTHIRLGHFWRFLLWDILCTLLWVNPLLRLCTPKLREDMEQVCDAVSIRESGRDPLSYGRVILKTLALLREEAACLPAAFTGGFVGGLYGGTEFVGGFSGGLSGGFSGETEFVGGFSGGAGFAEAKRRLALVRSYRPFSRRRDAVLTVCTAVLLLVSIVGIQRLSLPRYTNLTGFTIYQIRHDTEFVTMYASEESDLLPLSWTGDCVEIDYQALSALLPEDAPADGLYGILWGGFLKMPGIGGALNAVYFDGIAAGETTFVEFCNVDALFYVKLMKWM